MAEAKSKRKRKALRDVVVDENSYWNWNKKQVEQHTDMEKSEVSVAGIEASLHDFNKLEDEFEEVEEPLKRKTKSIAEIYEKWNHEVQIFKFKAEMEKIFEMTDLVEMKYFLGMEIQQEERGIFISQQKYASDLLKRFKMKGCKAVSTPLVANEKLSKENTGRSVILQGFSDSDWVGSLDDSKSTSGYAFSLGSGVFSWSSRKQEVVAQSSAEAKYIAATGAANQAIWSKHIKVKFHALRQAEAIQEIKQEHCKSKEQIADIMTKSLQKAKFEMQRRQLGVLKKNLKEEC
ncbi:hypothetical protein GH714_000518 [Hevea brasiliensis]|uniref:Reverse transcriptase Ty1/copia-type domain-containing protein n=1 Tax=Hevea brasiliensis TaxID=3981 RepID=A0A6A6N9T5_HEVBR|nr:hypothetical protein GH714_000518 [Hevea brasiliensis]